jgi:hypothetical protein
MKFGPLIALACVAIAGSASAQAAVTDAAGAKPLLVQAGQIVPKPQCVAGKSAMIVIDGDKSTPKGTWAAVEHGAKSWMVTFDGAQTDYKIKTLVFCE